MGRLTIRKYITDQWTRLPPISEYRTDLAGKTVVVVGANVGLGLEATRHFAGMGPGRLIMACRNMDKAQKAVQSVRKTTGCENVEGWNIDLADFKSIRAFADKYEQEGGGRLDLLIMNAAVQSYRYAQTVDGWENILQTNHLGTSLLTLLLLPYLQQSPVSPPTPRIVVVTSEGHFFFSSLDEANSPNILKRLNEPAVLHESVSRSELLDIYTIWFVGDADTATSVMIKRYWVTKMFNIFFVRSLASRLSMPSSTAPSLAVTSVNPGWCNSELNREIKWTWDACIVWILGPILSRSTEVGSRTLVWAALAGKDAGGEVHGRYTASCRVEEESDYILSKEGVELEERVWKETMVVLRNVDSRLEQILYQHLDRV